MLESLPVSFWKELGRSYNQCLAESRRKSPDDPMRAGRLAGSAFADTLVRFGVRRLVVEQRTGVSAGAGGQTRFDVCFQWLDSSYCIEVQATNYVAGHKAPQEQSQILSFLSQAHQQGPCFYLKIYGAPRTIDAWSRQSYERVFQFADYTPEYTITY